MLNRIVSYSIVVIGLLYGLLGLLMTTISTAGPALPVYLGGAVIAITGLIYRLTSSGPSGAELS